MMKKDNMILLGLSIMSAVMMSVPFLVPTSGFLALFGLIPLLCMDRIATLSGKRHVWLFHYSAFVIWNALTTFWVCNATVGGGLFAIFANAFQMSLIFGLFRLRVAILSMHSSGISPKSARNPLFGTRNGTDIMTADMIESPNSIILSFFIIFVSRTLGQRYK